MKTPFRCLARHIRNVFAFATIASALVLSSGVAQSQKWGEDVDDYPDDQEHSDSRRKTKKKRRAQGLLVPNESTSITITSTWPHTTLMRASGLGTGTVATHTTTYSATRGTSVSPGYATVQATQFSTLCDAPCTIAVPAGSYSVTGPGMNSRNFYVPQSDDHLELRVEGAPEWPMTVSWGAIIVGGSLVLLGAVFWKIEDSESTSYKTIESSSKSDTTPYMFMTVTGAAILVGGVVGMVASRRTHVYDDRGELLDAKAQQTRQVGKLRFSPSGLLF
ncbi:MAG: hypothetical protein FWD57_07075 [Polyangiaceae bacterium]|nr:hypothetical protein [Polyangiaceae bacterium]